MHTIGAVGIGSEARAETGLWQLRGWFVEGGVSGPGRMMDMSAVERLPASTAAELPRRRLLAWLVLVVRREDGLGPHYHRLSDVGDAGGGRAKKRESLMLQGARTAVIASDGSMARTAKRTTFS